LKALSTAQPKEDPRWTKTFFDPKLIFVMQLQLIGPHPFGADKQEAQPAHIGTIFPEQGVLYTQPPPVHAWQRQGFIDWLNGQRTAKAQPSLTPAEEDRICEESVDLIFEPGLILIRPNPARMDLAFSADELLQKLVSKRQIKFLSLSDPRVRESIKNRGEAWRLSSIPKTREGREKLLSNSKVAIQGQPIYYYNRLTGTRWLTFQELERLGALDNSALARHLQEIADHAFRFNRLDRPEIDFFAADLRKFGARDFAGVLYEQLTPEQLRTKYESLKEHFRMAVHEAFRKDDCKNKAWAERILSTLFLEGNEAQTEQILSGLSPEFFMQVEWLPGGRFEEGEFIFDSIFDEPATQLENAELQRLCDPRARGIIFNFIRDYGDLQYVNVGRVPEPLSLDRPKENCRRGVYIAELKSRSREQPIKRFMRLQKWGVWEHLEEGKDLLTSIEESEDYTDYCLDRRLGCLQLGMNLTRRVIVRRLSEMYAGANQRYRGQPIRTTYFEREYLPGIASDKVAVERYARPDYAARLAALLGRAAAVSLVVGRSMAEGTRPVFDDGDEVIREGDDGLPSELLVCDHTGAFGDYKSPLDKFAAYYAVPVNKREKLLLNPVEFAEAYLAALREQFIHIRDDYRKRRRAFDSLFNHCKYDLAGSFAVRWEYVLRRMDQANVDSLIQVIRGQIRILNGVKTQPPANGQELRIVGGTPAIASVE
jgi:hypothetical protein